MLMYGYRQWYLLVNLFAMTKMVTVEERCVSVSCDTLRKPGGIIIASQAHLFCGPNLDLKPIGSDLGSARCRKETKMVVNSCEIRKDINSPTRNLWYILGWKTPVPACNHHHQDPTKPSCATVTGRGASHDKSSNWGVENIRSPILTPLFGCVFRG